MMISVIPIWPGRYLDTQGVSAVGTHYNLANLFIPSDSQETLIGFDRLVVPRDNSAEECNNTS